MARSKVNVSNIEWEISIHEWEIRIPEGSLDLEPETPKRLHKEVFEKILQVFGGLISYVVSLCKAVWQHGAEDPRRIFHAIKVGIALVLVSIFYFNDLLFGSFGDMTVWAVMTVVVIFEFTAGATLGKGLNRMFATFLGGALAVLVNLVARLGGKLFHPIILAAGVFFFCALATFTRLSPSYARYDYGFMIFILTFSVISISGYRQELLLNYALDRLETVLAGCGIAMATSLLIYPIWAGDDLHKLILRNLEGLAVSLEGCVTEYFKESSDKDSDKNKVTPGYTRVLNSKAREEALANFARWEFAQHGRFGFRYPWNQYVKIGATIRYCSYCVDALNGCLNSEIQESYFLRHHLKEPCMNIVAEVSKIIIELAESIKTMTRSTRINLMNSHLNKAVEELQNCLKSQPGLFIDNKRWQIVEEDPRPNFINTKIAKPSKSENTQVLRIKKAAGEANKKPVISSKTRLLPITLDDSVAVQNTETVEDVAFMDTLSLATVACLLTKIAARLETVIIAVDELGELANFPFAEDEELGKRPYFTTSVEHTPVVHNYNAPAKGSPHYPSPSRPQAIQNPEAKVPPSNLSPSPPQTVQNPAVKVLPPNLSPSPPQPVQNPTAKVLPPNLSPSPPEPVQISAAVIPAAEQLPRLPVKSVRWAPM